MESNTIKSSEQQSKQQETLPNIGELLTQLNNELKLDVAHPLAEEDLVGTMAEGYDLKANSDKFAADILYNGLTKPEENIIFVVAGKIGLEATHDKIIIMLDPFKSGYECKTCGGSGIEKRCECKSGLNRLGGMCKLCDGDPDRYTGKECRACKGVGSTIILPESAKQLPTSGRIVSCGPECKIRRVGERVLFGAHTGYFLPFKGNIRLRVMREYEPLCQLHAIEEDVALGDFFTTEEGM